MSDSLQSFPRLPSDFKDAAELVQQQFKESLAALDERVAELGREHDRRKTTATVLKVASVLSSLIIASGLVAGIPSQILGGVIAAVAALERVFANMSRLLAVAAGKAAYERARMQIVANHNRKIVGVVKYRDRDPENAANSLIKLVGELRDQIANIRETVESALSKNAYENLGRLNLDELEE